MCWEVALPAVDPQQAMPPMPAAVSFTMLLGRARAATLPQRAAPRVQLATVRRDLLEERRPLHPWRLWQPLLEQGDLLLKGLDLLLQWFSRICHARCRFPFDRLVVIPLVIAHAVPGHTLLLAYCSNTKPLIRVRAPDTTPSGDTH